MRTIRNRILGATAAGLLAALGGSTQAAGIYDPSLIGNVQTSDWENASLQGAANPGYGGMPGTQPWPGGVKPTTGDAELIKISNGPGGAGGPFPGGGSIYFGGFSGQINNNGGTLAVVDATPVANLANVVFQIQIAEAWGYDFYNHVLPVLNYDGGNQSLAATFSTCSVRVETGLFTTPEGEIVPIYKNSYLLQWDLTGLADPIQSFAIQFTGVQHAQVYALRLDQSDVYESLDQGGTPAVPEPASLALLICGVGAVAWRTRRRSI